MGKIEFLKKLYTLVKLLDKPVTVVIAEAVSYCQDSSFKCNKFCKHGHILHHHSQDEDEQKVYK